MYTNDKKAPRMKKGKYSTSIVNKELWKEFKKDFGDINWEDFVALWEEIAETIRIETTSNPLGVKLGSYMGELKCQYLPYDYDDTDIVASTEIGEKVGHANFNTRGKVAKVKWERRWAVKFNKLLQFYAFEPTREIKLLAKRFIDSNPNNIRVARNTLGGKSVWRNIKNYGK